MLEDLTKQQLDWYHLQKRLGGGSFGTVYLAQDLRRKREVAVKVVDPNTTTQEQFYREVNELMRLHHPHIIPVIGFGIAHGIPYIVTDYAPGGSLQTRHPMGTQVPLTTIVSYVTQIAAALQHAHDDQLLHRDVKPENVLIGANGEMLLGDFGIATLSQTGLIDIKQPLPSYQPGGTPYYMAPEQCQGKPEKSSDQYALAIMAYQWLTGKPPFYQGSSINIQYQQVHELVPSLRASVPTLDARVEAVILRALAKKPEDRYESVQSFAHALEVAAQTPPIGTLLLTYSGHSGPVMSVAWSPDGSRLASASDDGSVQVWEALSGRQVRTYSGHSGPVMSVAWSPDGSRLASASGDKTVQVWEALSGRQVRTYSGHANVVRSVAWSPDGSRLASASRDKTVQVWEALSGRQVRTYSGHSDWVMSVAWSPDGSRLASASGDKTVQVWEALSGRQVRTYSGHANVVRSVAWSPDGSRLASASRDKTVQVWEALSGRQVRTYSGHSDWVMSVAWSPDGSRLASASGDKTVQVWEALSGRQVRTYSGHSDWVMSVAWSPDGSRLASASGDKTVQVWEALSGRQVRTYSGHANVVRSVAWSPDGSRLASASKDKTVHIWQAV